MSSQKPKNLGEYYLLERVAVGGMAEIYKAKTYGVGGFEKLVAIKRILPHHAQNQEFITMLIDEAKIAVALNHVNIVQVYDLGKYENDYFIAMEFVEGRDLRTVMRRCKKLGLPITLENAVYIILEICKGLDYAHRKTDKGGSPLGVVHRDISPQNILISFEGEVKIVDFGIAKAANKVTETEAGILKGKFSYMSPEQASGKMLDQRTDIFSAGLIMYELLSGEKLFQGQNHIEILEKIRNSHIEPPFLPADVPSELEYILAHALAHDTEERYHYASDFQVELTKFLYSSSLDFTARNLAELMKRIFQDEMEDDRKKERVDFEVDEDTRSLMLKSHSESLVSKTDLALEDNTNTGEIELPPKNRTIIQKFQKMLRRDYIPPNPKHSEASTDKVPMEGDFPAPYKVTINPKPLVEINPMLHEKTEPLIEAKPQPKKNPPPIANMRVVGSMADTPAVPIRLPLHLQPKQPEPESKFDEWLENFREMSLTRKVAGLIAFTAVVMMLIMLAAVLSRNDTKPGGDKAQASPTPAINVKNQRPTPVPVGDQFPRANFNPQVTAKRPAVLVVESVPGGAKVLRDENIELGETPLKIFNIPPDQKFDLILKAKNHQTWDQTLTLAPNEEKSLRPTLDPIFGSIEVNSTPSGARVLLNKKYVGQTPLRYEKVLPDIPTLLSIEKDGFEEYSLSFRVGPDESRIFNKVLEEANHSLTISSSPSGAQIFLNGVNSGITPREFTGLNPNSEYVVVLRLSGYRDFVRKVRVESIEGHRLAARLEAQNRRLGTLFLDSDPPGASIILNGKTLPQVTPLVLDQMRTDQSYKVQIMLNNYEPEEFTDVRVDSEQISTRKAILRRLKGRLTVKSDPPNASIYLNNQLIGETPLAYYAVDSGVDYVVTLKKAAHKEQIKTFRLEPRQTKILNFTLEPLVAPPNP